jgi:hypothetical protein
MKLKTFFLVIALLSAVAARAEPAGDDPSGKGKRPTPRLRSGASPRPAL